MRRTPWLALILFATALATVAGAKDPIADSVVKIFATCRGPDFERPWSKAAPRETAGSGVILEGKRILTNAHVVSYASQIFVQGNQSTERVPAKVKVAAPGLDLAIVEVEDRSFFDHRAPVPLARELPAMRQTVSVYGYPVGGEQLSITQGIVSRIEYSQVSLFDLGLRIQIDAAVNPGNSGGPAVADGKLLGLVFGKIEKAENIGYLIAAEEIAMFLADVADGVYHGKLGFWDLTLPAEQDALRGKLGLGSQSGVMVCEPFGPAADYPLKKWDVITRIADQPLDNLGNVKVKDDLRLSFLYLVPKVAKDNRIKLTVVRERQTIDLSVPVRRDRNLVLPSLNGGYPRYFIYGPMVFLQATQENTLILGASSTWNQLMMVLKSPLLMRIMDQRAYDGEEIVTLGQGLLPHRTSKGCRVLGYSVVTHVNGAAVRNLAHLVELLRDAKGEFLVIDLAGRSPPLVFRREETLKATDEILSDEGIRKQCSDDLEKIWHARK